MAFDFQGLIQAQMAAALEYAEDQGVLLDDFEYCLRNGERKLDVEVYFTHPQRILADRSKVNDLRIKFVTMFQTITYCWAGDSRTVTLVDELNADSDIVDLSPFDRLRLLTMAIEDCATSFN